MMRHGTPHTLAVAIALAACGHRSVAPATSNTPPAPSSPTAMAPVVLPAPAPTDTCPLEWEDLYAEMPRRIELSTLGADACTDDAEPTPCPDCATDGAVASGARAHHEVDGPAGSEKLWTWRIVVGDRVACGEGSTVGWRHFAGKPPAAEIIAPLQWFADVDGDGTYEVIVWQPLAWGDAALTMGLVPFVYAVDTEALVRRDDLAQPLRSKVAAAYRLLAATTDPRELVGDFVACYRALATGLD